jgi:tetratricopeptide (TPR) repeat protein
VRALALLLSLSLSLSLSGPAFADDAHALVQKRQSEGERRWQDQDYRGAIDTLQLVVSDPIATVDERARAWEYLGICWLVLGKKARAREAFEDLLALDPQYTLSEPSRSPKLRAFFEDVRNHFLPGYRKNDRPSDVELDHAAPPSAQAGRPLEVAVVVTRGAGAVEDVSLRVRRQGLLTWDARHMRREEEGRFRLTYSPPRDAADYVLEYYLEARDAQGHVVARVASPERPIALVVKGVLMATPWFKRWYVWAAVGAAVVAVGVGVGVAESAQHAPAGSLPPGKVDLGLRF